MLREKSGEKEFVLVAFIAIVAAWLIVFLLGL